MKIAGLGNTAPAKSKPRKLAPHASAGFGAPLARADAPITTAQHLARQRVQRAQTRLPQRPLPAIPTLAHPTQTQAQHAVRLANRAVARIPVASRGELQQDPRSRARLAPVAQMEQAVQHELHVRMGLAEIRRDPASYGVTGQQLVDLHRAAAGGRLPGPVRSQLAHIGAGVHRRLVSEIKPAHLATGVAGAVGRLSDDLSQHAFAQAPNLRLVQAPFEIARAAVQHPLQVIPRTLSGAAGLVTGALAAPFELGIKTAQGAAHGDPALGVRSLADAAKADYVRRYGPLLAGNTQAFRQRITREGAAPELADIATVAAPEGAVLGRGLGAAARTGALGDRLARFASEDRPRLRVSGGKVVAQDLSPNLFRAGGQRLEDVVRSRATVRRAQQATRSGAPVRGLQPGEGEVVKATLRGQRRAQATTVAQRQAIGFHRQQREQAREVRLGAEREISKLSKPQRAAVFHVVQGLVTPDDPARAVRQLRQRRSKMVAEREARGVAPAVGTRSTNDELAAIDFLIHNAPRVFGGKAGARLRAFHEAELARSARVERGDPGVRESTALVRRYRPQGELLGVQHEFDRRSAIVDQALADGRISEEQAAQGMEALAAQKPVMDRRYVADVQAAARHAGLPEPIFISHRPRPAAGHSDYAPGGARAIQGPQRSTFSLFRRGLADVTPRAYVQSLARTIKRKHNWRTVADQFEAHALRLDPQQVGRILGRRGAANVRSLTLHEARKVVDHLGLDPADVGFWNPGRLRAAATEHADRGLAHAEAEHEPVAGLHSGVAQGTTDEARLAELDPGDRERFLKTRGWQVVPRGAYDEITASTRPSGLTGRLVDKAQGLQSRVLLGTSPAWLQIQIASNAVLTGFGVRGNLPDFAKAMVWWHSLPPEARDAVDDYLGHGVFAAHGQRTHLGAAVSDRNRLVNAWRAFSETAVAKAAQRANPMNVLFRIDDAQNKFFKRTLFYNQAKREAYARIGRTLGPLARANAQLAHVLSLGPRDAMAAIIRDPALIERQARYVNDLLGDWTTFTAKERRVFKRSVLFYGYFRFSLRLLFYTLPVKHPLAAVAGTQLAKLHNAEVNDLLGGPAAPWAYSRIYFGKGGALRSIDVGRANPLSNPVVSVMQEGPKALAGLQSPLLGALFDQVYGEHAFTGQRFHTGGSAEENPNPHAPTRARIFANDLLSLAFPYREAVKATQGAGRLGDDTLLFSPRHTRFKSAASIARNQQRIQRAGPVSRQVLRDVFPLALPKPEDPASLTATRAPTRPASVSGGPVSPQQRLLERAAERSANGGYSDAQMRLLERAAIRQAGG